MSQSENPISQLYATECILRLYPNEAAALLAPLKENRIGERNSRLSENGVTTLSDLRGLGLTGDHIPCHRTDTWFSIFCSGIPSSRKMPKMSSVYECLWGSRRNSRVRSTNLRKKDVSAVETESLRWGSPRYPTCSMHLLIQRRL